MLCDIFFCQYFWKSVSLQLGWKMKMSTLHYITLRPIYKCSAAKSSDFATLKTLSVLQPWRQHQILSGPWTLNKHRRCYVTAEDRFLFTSSLTEIYKKKYIKKEKKKKSLPRSSFTGNTAPQHQVECDKAGNKRLSWLFCNG